MTRAVLLDALGTLVGFAPPAPALQRSLAARGVAVPMREAGAAVQAEITYYRAHLHRAHDDASLAVLRAECADVVAQALPQAAELSREELVAAVLEAFRFVAFPEAEAELAALRAAGIPLVVCSNWDVSLHDVLRDVGLAPYFAGVVTSAELGISKPDPRPFAAALALVGDVAPGDALHVGDSIDEDVAGARAAGVPAVFVDRDGAAGDAPAGALDGAVVLPSLAGLAALAARETATGP